MLKHWSLLPILLLALPVAASDEVTEIRTQQTSAEQTIVGTGNEQHIWGQGDNLNLQGFVANDSFHRAIRTADRVSIVRRDIDGIADGEPCGLFAERVSGNPRRLIPDYASDSITSNSDSSECSESVALSSTVINRGTLDTFSNRGRTRGNIERLDLIFDKGQIAPLSENLTGLAGHLVAEKSGNNRVQLAAILSLDSEGNPSAYGPLIRIGRVGECNTTSLCYAQTPITHDYSFFKSEPLSPQSDPVLRATNTESVTLAFATLETLGIEAGTVYFGISVFGDDVQPPLHDLLNPAGFPDDTEDLDVSPGDSADLYGGLAGYYESELLSAITGIVTCSAQQTTPIALSGWPVSLYFDQNASNMLETDLDTLVSQLPGTGVTGDFSFSGLPPGTYFVEVSAPSTIPSNSTTEPLSDAERRQTVIVAQGQFQTLDFALTVGCVIPGPVATEDEATSRNGNPITISVLTNDIDSNGQVDSPELILVGIEDTNTSSDISVNGRSIDYVPGRDLLDLLTPANSQFETFNYQITDSSGLTSEATVTVELVLTNDGTANCVAIGPDCLFVETEVEGIGIGKTPQFLLFLLAGYAVIRLFKPFDVIRMRKHS